ncbi:MAG: AAA family ATPase [Bacteroidales bacterium]|nr:AAA family ATPase [Bacteroidales bacterium]
MSLPVKERVRKRKAISPVFLDTESERNPENGDELRKVHFTSNLSDFKEGDTLLLHKDGVSEGIECTLWRFEGENDIVLDIFFVPAGIEAYYDTPLILDRNCVDLRPNVYDHFLCELPPDIKYWQDSIINRKAAPVLENLEKNREELEETIQSFELNLLPRQKEAILNSMCAKDYYLIQGPPGTGKSFVLGLIILEELVYFRRKVVVVGPNHMAVNNVLGQVLKLYPQINGCIIKVGQSYNAPTAKVVSEDVEYTILNTPYLPVSKANELEGPILFGLTPHCLYTRRARDLKFDTLIIDEAGQMTIPLALMGMRCAEKVILAGDHKQLPPIISAEKIDPTLKTSIFQTLVSPESCTMLDVSFRMCEPICEFVSKLFYDGELKPRTRGHKKTLAGEDALYSFSSPIVFMDVDDKGEQVSEKEAEAIAETVCGFIKRGIPAKEIGVLSPFRAQAATIRRHLRKKTEVISEEQLSSLAVDTVDKMQGQERDIIFFSFTSGNPDYMTEMAEFLYNSNKLNVAFSRAKSKLILVGNKRELLNVNSADFPQISRMFQLLDEEKAAYYSYPAQD